MLSNKLGRPLLPTLAHLAEHLTVVVISNFGYQRVAGSIPASRKIIFNMYFKILIKLTSKMLKHIINSF